MSKTTHKISSFGQIALMTGIGCIACCAVPLLGVAIGSVSMAGLSIYSEKAAAMVFLLGITALVIKRLIGKPAPSCDLNGHCAPTKKNAVEQDNA